MSSSHLNDPIDPSDPTGDAAFADVVLADEHPPAHSLSTASVKVKLIVLGVFALITSLLYGAAAWALFPSEAAWPTAVASVGRWTLVAAGLVMLVSLLLANGRWAGSPRGDTAARVGHVLLGLGWLFFSWTLVTDLVLRLPLLLAGVENPTRSRVVALSLAALVAVLAVYGLVSALRVPRVRRTQVTVPGLGAGFDGLKIAVLTDTHFDAFTSARWSRRLVGVVNGLGADVVVHAGDLADGSVPQRRECVEALAEVSARTRLYIAGNHEYYSDAPAWISFMAGLGWRPLVNQHVLLESGADQLVIAGLDDPTGTSIPGHGPSLDDALAGAPDAPVVLLAHQPSQVRTVAGKVDLQISGHTHGGQIWPFHLLVRLREPSVQGLSRHGERTQLFTSRGSGFWGPPFRVFAPSEVSLLTLSAG